MKKLFFVTITAMFLFASANAQLFQFGLKAGVNFSSLSMDDITGISSGTQVYDLVTGESVAGYQFGVMTRVNVAMVFIQPEVYFNSAKAQVQQVFTDGTTALLDVKANRVDIPLLVGLKLGPARINLGPVGSAVISSSNELVDLASAGVESLSKNFTWGYQAGIGLDLFKKLAIDARYEGSLSRFGDTYEIGGDSYPLGARPAAWIFSLGYWF